MSTTFTPHPDVVSISPSSIAAAISPPDLPSSRAAPSMVTRASSCRKMERMRSVTVGSSMFRHLLRSFYSCVDGSRLRMTRNCVRCQEGIGGGSSQQKPLRDGDAEGSQHGQIVGLLDALGDHDGAEIVGQTANRAKDCLPMKILGTAIDEVTINLQKLWPGVEDHPVIAVTEAKIIDRSAHADCAQRS